jgi:hypothetical protein
LKVVPVAGKEFKNKEVLAMTNTILEEFKQYAYFSVRVDQFFNVVNIYGRHHHDIKFVYSQLPSHEIWQSVDAIESIPDEIRRFLRASSSILEYMATTGIFSDGSDIDPISIPDDVLNFAFYTCYCFQWSLFETFVKTMIQKLIDADKLPDDTKKKLESTMGGRTEKFFKIIDSGNVFGHSPFKTVLLVGLVPTPEKCDYKDLDTIRRQRNDFVHGIVSPEITSDNIIIKQRKYERSMWILRKFAENVQFEVNKLLGK